MHACLNRSYIIGYPKEQAASIALKVVHDWLKTNGNLSKVHVTIIMSIVHIKILCMDITLGKENSVLCI